jgi:hypothetical protein
VRIKRYRRWPALDRAICAHCEQPAFGVFRLGPLRALAFVPSANFGYAANLPTPAAHLFYHRRTADHDDALPKYSGYWRSEWGASLAIARGMLGR